MHKKTPSSVTTELVIPGQPSNEQLALLKDLGSRVSDDQLIEALREIERRRVSFVVGAIVGGVGFFAKKEALPHGDWMDWSAKFAGKYRAAVMAKCEHPFRISDELSHRSVQLYIFLARHFLADLEQNRFQPDEKDVPVPPLALGPSEVLTLATLPPTTQSAVVARIEQWINGRSLRRMLIDFRRAESAADQEEAEERARAERRQKRTEDPRQFDFWDELNRPLSELDTLMKSPDFVERTTKEGWLKLADELTAKAREARAMAAKIA